MEEFLSEVNLALAISRRDRPLALVWAKWVAGLGLPEGTKLYLTVDQKVDDDTLSAVHHVFVDHRIPVDLEIYFGEDPGYPGGANRMFVFTARRAAKDGKPFLWIEADMVPLERGWLDAVKREYKRKKKPFLGPILHIYSDPHLNGTAVYPPDWEERSNITECPDHWPWDTFSRDSVVVAGQAAKSSVIRHTFGNKTFPADSSVLKGCKVFHPCKDTSLIRMLNEKEGLLTEDDFIPPPIYVRWEGYQPGIGDYDPISIPMTGCRWYCACLSTLKDQIMAYRTTKPIEIDKQEYEQLSRQ